MMSLNKMSGGSGGLAKTQPFVWQTQRHNNNLFFVLDERNLLLNLKPLMTVIECIKTVFKPTLSIIFQLAILSLDVPEN